MKKILRLLFLSVFGLGVGLIIAEFASRLFLPAPVPWKFPLLRYEVAADCGYRFQPNREGYQLSGLARINRDGFRGGDWEIEKPAGVKRILILGDSMAFGPGMNDDETFTALMEASLNEGAPLGTRYEVMNFSVPGYDTGHEICILERYAMKFKPDAVFLNFYLNDLIYVRDYGVYPQLFKQGEKAFNESNWKRRELIRKSRLVMTIWDLMQARAETQMTRIVRAYVEEGVAPPKGNEDGWQFVEGKLAEFKKLASGNGFKPALVILPLPQEVQGAGGKSTYPEYLNLKASAAGIDFIEMLPALKQSGLTFNEILIPYDNHLNREGHRIAAQALAEAAARMLGE
ncbi:MAG: SGNH/GDSL hydrolase family protein [Deltaproteobacteria bacterium]